MLRLPFEAALSMMRATGDRYVVGARGEAWRKTSRPLLQSAENPGPHYDREPTYASIARDMDVMVPMRDGVKICVDVYRPQASGKFPALLAFAIYNKDFQGPDMAEALPPQPAWSPLWTGPMEAGDTKFFVSRGYVHVIGSPRGVGKSEGGGSREWDCYDLIEWIAAQDWCDGNVGMVGISGFGAEQLAVAKKQPPHLKAIFPFDSRGAYGELGGFRDEYPGGVIHLFRYLVGHFSAMHQHKGPPGALPAERERLWREAMNNPDYKMYPHVYNLIAQKGQHMPPYYNVLVDPFDCEAAVQKSEAEFETIKVPTYTGSGWYGYTYKTHLNGCQHWYSNIKAPKKLLLAGPAHLERPYHTFHSEVLRWHDHWLKGIDTGIMDDAPVRYWLMGANEWRNAERLAAAGNAMDQALSQKLGAADARHDCAVERDRDAAAGCLRANAAVADRRRSQRLRYMTDPLPHDVVVAGPIVVTLYAAIDQDDTNWIVILKDVGPDVSVMSVREGEREVRKDLHRARDHPRLAQGLAPGDRSEAFKAVVAVASADPRSGEAGHAGRDRGISDRGDGDGEYVPQRPPHLPRHHQPRPADRRRRRHQCRICAVPYLLEQDGAA